MLNKHGNECNRNLHCANHVIFFSPLLVETDYDYESTMKQAIGRARRHRQEKTVHIYHFLASRTVDVTVFEGRRNQTVVERNGEPMLVSTDEEFGSDVKRLGPQPLRSHEGK